MSVKTSAGQALIEKIEAFLTSYLVFPNPHLALVAALWVINSHWFEVFDATPYLALTAATKRAGKTTLLELLSFLGRNSERIGAATRADTLYSVMEAYESKCVLMFDEAERMSSSTAGVMRAMMNAGYRVGEYVFRKRDGKIVKLGCYCPKLFALIGDPTDTLRDRCILMVLARAIGPKPYRPTQAAREAAPIKREIEALAEAMRRGAMPSFTVRAPEWLENRDQEIWEPLWSFVSACGDAALIDRFQRASSFLVAGKGAEIKRFVEHESELEADTYGERVIRDLVSVLDAPSKTHTGDIPSAIAVERLRAIATAPWANYKGEGLTEMKLASLLEPLGVSPSTIRPYVGNRKQWRGYTRKSLLASCPSVTAAQVGKKRDD